MKKNDFVISVNGLAQGETVFSFSAGKEFFAKFGNDDVLDADLQVSLTAFKQRNLVDWDCAIDGSLTVTCDRCGSPVAVPVSVSRQFRLRLSGNAEAVGDKYEEVFLPEGSDLLDFSQEIYDYSLLALPLQRIHGEGGCDKTALGCLSGGNPEDDHRELTDSPFANLAEMFDKKIKD